MALFLADGGASVRYLLEEAGTQETHPLMEIYIKQNQPLSAFEYGTLLVRLDGFRGSMLHFMETHDVILCPVNANPAMPHGISQETSVSNYSYTGQFQPHRLAGSCSPGRDFAGGPAHWSASRCGTLA